MNTTLDRSWAPTIEADTGTTYGVLRDRAGTVYDVPEIVIPRWQPPTLKTFARMANELQEWTGWSLRRLADVLGTTHPTAKSLLDGSRQAGSRNPALLHRLERAHGVIHRIHVLAGQDVQRTAAALDALTTEGCAADLIPQDEPDRAYLAGLEALRPSRQNGMLVGSRPVKPGTGTVDYLEPR
jgi:hypothetical protein